jgi:TrmH family RNA methyltransferase
METELNQRLRNVTSAQNTLVKQLRRAFTQSEAVEGYCAIESVRIVEEAIRSGLRFRAVFFAESSAKARGERILPQISPHVEAIVLPDNVFASAVATETPQGVAALVKIKESSLEATLAPVNPLLVGVVGIQDPGNLGTIIRSTEAFDGTGVLLGKGTVSQFNPKVVRASAGSLFRMNVVHADLGPTLPQLRERGVRLVATSSHKAKPVQDVNLTGPLCLFIGSEGAGLPRHIVSEMDEVVAIPHSARVESLNAGVAASILLYEIARQRRG